MATTEERMKILKMIADKQITAEEGARLLEALRASSAEPPRGEPFIPKWLRIRVTDRATGKVKVNVNLPAGLLDVGLKMGARFAPEMHGMDFNVIQTAIREGRQGRVMEAEDERTDERVEIYVE